MRRICPSCGAKVRVIYLVAAIRLSFERREGVEDQPPLIAFGPAKMDETNPFCCRQCMWTRTPPEGCSTVQIMMADLAAGAWPDLSDHERSARVGEILRAWRAHSAGGIRARAWLHELAAEAERQSGPRDELWERRRDVSCRWLDRAIERGILRTDEEGNVIPERRDIEIARRRHADELADEPDPRSRRDLLRWLAGLYAMMRGEREAEMSERG